MNKPLNGKAYGSIGHFPNSRMGPGDHKLPDGQFLIATEKMRDRHDRIMVEEKLDGSCCAIAKVGGQILSLSRSGNLATTSRFELHHIFAMWVREREHYFHEWLHEGERFCGEWLAVAHGTRYIIEDPWDAFIVFDLMRVTGRVPFDERNDRLDMTLLRRPFLIGRGGPIRVEAALDILGTHGHHRALDAVEGAVWRAERKGEFDFMGKYVHAGKTDGSFLPEISGKETVWNWRP